MYRLARPSTTRQLFAGGGLMTHSGEPRATGNGIELPWPRNPTRALEPFVAEGELRWVRKAKTDSSSLGVAESRSKTENSGKRWWTGSNAAGGPITSRAGWIARILLLILSVSTTFMIWQSGLALDRL